MGALFGALGLLRSPLGKALGLGLIAVVALGYAYMKGAGDAGAKCQEAALRAEIATLKADLDIARRAEANAKAQEAAAERRETTLNERLQTYETGLGDPPPACLLTPDDARGLRELTR